MGMWMLASKVCLLFDGRMIASRCGTDSFAVWDGTRCAGVCNPPKEFPAYMADAACTGPFVADKAARVFHIGSCPWTAGARLSRRRLVSLQLF